MSFKISNQLSFQWVNTGWVIHECGKPNGIRKRHNWIVRQIARGRVMRFCSNCGREDKAMVFLRKKVKEKGP